MFLLGDKIAHSQNPLGGGGEIYGKYTINSSPRHFEWF